MWNSATSGQARVIVAAMVSDKQHTVVMRWIVASCCALALGSIGTWANATLLGIDLSATGLSGGGWVTLAVACSAAVLVLQPGWIRGWTWGTEHRHGLSVGLAGLALLVCLMNLGGFQNSGLSGLVSPGWGLYLATFSSASLTVSTAVLRSHAAK